jgi:VAD1 Analog of StAR-related lipid transfer domain
MPAFAALTGSKLCDIEISVPLQKFVEIVWVNGDYLSTFLTDKLFEKDVAITEWKTVRSSRAERVKFERAISSQHPLPISLPWLPLFIESSNIQSLEYDHMRRMLRIVEISTIKGLPFVDPFIITEWDVHELPTGSCKAHITLRFEYEKSSWLQSMVESNSRTELVRFFEMWEVNFALQLTALKESNELGKKPVLHSLSRLFLVQNPFIEEPIGATVESSPVILSSNPPTDISNATNGNALEGRINTDTPIISKPPAYIQQKEKVLHPSEKMSLNYNDEGVFDSSIDGSRKWSSSQPMGDFTDRNILFETIAALIINYFHGIKVAALHGIEVNSSFRFVQPTSDPVNCTPFRAFHNEHFGVFDNNDGHPSSLSQMAAGSNCFNIFDILLHLDL